MKKECFSILLPTNKASDLFISKGGLEYTPSHFQISTTAKIVNQFLYICSNEEIKEYDYYCYSKDKQVHQHLGVKSLYGYDSELCSKIIATTNKELWLKIPIEGQEGHFVNKPLSSIPQSFIQKYVELYNKGKKTEKCMVEYEERGFCQTCNNQGVRHCAHPEECGASITITQPKLNGNEIIISECEEKLYTRAEVEAIVRNFATYCGLEHGNYTKPNQWFNKNI